MQRPPPRHRSYGAAAFGPSTSGDRFLPPGYFYPNVNPQFPGNIPYSQLPPSLSQPAYQNPSVAYLQNTFLPNTGLTVARHLLAPPVTLETAESAAAKAHQDLVASGENVSVWKVSQSALVALKVDSWSSLGFQLQDVPTLHSLLLIEGKVNAFIHCFVCAQKITTIHDLVVSLCQNEGVRQFEELGLGPLLQHPLVMHYFAVSADSTEVFKITTEEIIHSLQVFMSKFKQKVSAEEFLIFLAKQKSVSIKENLGVRIQNIGFYLLHIREAGKAEYKLLRTNVANSKIEVMQKKSGSQPPNIAVEKKILDKHFGYISNCVKTFSSNCNEYHDNHVYFDSPDDCNEANEDIYSDYECDGNDKTNIDSYQSLSYVKGCGQLVSSCPYPSKTEEMERLGLNPADSHKISPATARIINKENRKSCRRKRKLQNNNNANLLCKYQKREEPFDLKVYDQMCDLTLRNEDIEKFVTTWKMICQEHSVSEVLDMMLGFYMEKASQRKKVRKFASSYPFIAMLNVAILSIKRGMLESVYDTFQALNENKHMGTDSVASGEIIEVMPPIEVGDPAISTDSGSGVTVDDIIKKVANYFENCESTLNERSLSPEKQLQAFKKLCECEMWLIAQFNIKEFSSFGHGNFYEFLVNHNKTLPHRVLAIFNDEHLQASSFDVCLIKHQLGLMLSQAEGNLMARVDSSTFDIVSLLKKQFPTASFCMVGLDPEKHLEKLNDLHKGSAISSCVLFSTCLLCDKGNPKSWTHKENSSMDIGGLETEVGQQHSTIRTSKDAIECLLSVPMLADLLYWSHWDLIYASSLGPLPEFLFNKVRCKNLLCIATSDGKFIRIDHNATVDEFLEAFVQCSSFNIALNLLSLLCLYRGTCNAPLALLKCYAQQAVDVIIQNSVDLVEINADEWSFIQGQIMHNVCACPNCFPTYGIKKCDEKFGGSTFSAGICRVNNAIATVCRMVLECLKCLPSEFRSFASEIFLSGLRTVAKQAPVIILNQCSQADERIMLHDIGISLGVTEWVTDLDLFRSSSAHELSVPSKTVKQSSNSFCLSSAFNRRNSTQISAVSASGNHKITPGKIGKYLVDGNHQFSSGVNCEASKIFTEFVDVDEGRALSHSIRMNTIAYDELSLHDATAIIESIRREEFGLHSNSDKGEDSLLKKQHARLGRALHCLSQELYSQDSHFILELVQNADDNMYPKNVVPELVFILLESGIVVLNNELGFSTENVRALCDVGNSTKKVSGGGYIGKKGIGFKSVFRVTDSPEIHSNGFHVKFDITQGQIGFVLPTVVPPCDASSFKQYLCDEDYQGNGVAWNTCILLPFRSQSKERTGVSSIVSMFSDLHPSLLLFLHRLRCIKFRNLLTDRLVVMRRETLHNGIVKVSHGEEIMSFLVINKKLQSSIIRTDVEATDISMAFNLQESDCGEYMPILRYQPVFSFLPLRNYGLKFILQGDFVLPSSREEVDGDSAWNQWLLSEFPSLFLCAKQSFCSLPSFLKHPGKAVTLYMSFVPLVGEVHGFFCQLPQMIISLLRVSNCLLQDSPDLTWVLPCRVLRDWNEQARLLLSDHLLQRHLGLVYLHKDIKLSDNLATILGIRDYGPKVLVEIIDSVCHSAGDLNSLGIDWLSAWLSAVHSSLSMNLSRHSSLNDELEYDVLNDLRTIPFIPLSDGSYGCVADGPIWLPCDVLNVGCKGEYHPEDFPYLYNKLKIVIPQLFSAASKSTYSIEAIKVDTIMQLLIKIGVQQLSAHEVIKSHILVTLSEEHTSEDRDLMIEYLSFIMLHLQSDCLNCHSERPEIIVKLRNLPILMTNYGYICPTKEPIHLGREYGNPVDVIVLFDSVDIKWVEVDASYLKHPSNLSLSSGLMKWRSFFLDLGVTDFVQVICIEKDVEDFFSEDPMCLASFNSAASYVKDWVSPELVNLLAIFSSQKIRSKCIFLLDVLDKMWDDIYSAQTRSFIISKIDGAKRPVVSSFMKNVNEFAWIACTMDMDLHKPKDVFYDCEQVRSVLGSMCPYAVPKVSSNILVNDFGFKMNVSIDDAMEILQFWRMSETPFVASIAQMLNFYTLISSAINTSSNTFKELASSRFIFVPYITCCQSSSLSGMFLSPKEVYWRDPTGCVDKMKELLLLCASTYEGNPILCQSLETVYPSLHDFFVNLCGVPGAPQFYSYFQILQQLSGIALPSQAAQNVFQVMIRWADDLQCGLVSPDQLSKLKDNILKLENTVLPTEQDKWVSLHPSFGLICWSDDDELKRQFKYSDGVDFIKFGELSLEENAILSRVANIFHVIGVPALSEIVSREAIFYGTEDNREKISLINWVIPYAQRYIHKWHLDTYLKLKELGFEKISQMQVIVVSKLFCKYTLQGRDCASKPRFECNCLLQGNILYTCQMTDSHSLFLEFSRFFFNGSPELHLANFLHMTATMVQSGSAAEQIESFTVNSQKIPKLSDDETCWPILSVCEVEKSETSGSIPDPFMDLGNGVSKSLHRKPGTSSHWPPADWKTAPDFEYSRTMNLRTRPWTTSCFQNSISKRCGEHVTTGMEDPTCVEITGDWTLEEAPMPVSMTGLQNSPSMPSELVTQGDSILEPTYQVEVQGDVSGQEIQLVCPKFLDEHLLRRTGRLGERLAYQYFARKHGSTDVRWVNEEMETGFPYDLIVEENGTSQYVEVKTTRSATKNWFYISSREWKFAVENENSYSIAHVFVSGPNKANVAILKNPYKLCHQGILGLALIMSRS